MGTAKPLKPVSRSFGFVTQPLELPARPADDIAIDPLDGRAQLIMRPICALLGALAFLPVGMSSAQANLRARAGSLDWQTFKLPEYGTRVEYPAGIFAAVGEAEKGVGQRFERDDGHAVLSVHARADEEGDTPTSY